jgi:hypothetical protein
MLSLSRHRGTSLPRKGVLEINYLTVIFKQVEYHTTKPNIHPQVLINPLPLKFKKNVIVVKWGGSNLAKNT